MSIQKKILQSIALFCLPLTLCYGWPTMPLMFSGDPDGVAWKQIKSGLKNYMDSVLLQKLAKRPGQIIGFGEYVMAVSSDDSITWSIQYDSEPNVFGFLGHNIRVAGNSNGWMSIGTDNNSTWSFAHFSRDGRLAPYQSR